MPHISTPAVLLRRIDFGDYDVIVTFFTLNCGKMTAIAKAAKKSTKRFGGILELFSALNIVFGSGRGKGLPVLHEAAMIHPFSNIRSDIRKTAYASYWAEMIYEWVEAHQKEADLYDLLVHVLSALDAGNMAEAALSILFQMRFLAVAGYTPNLSYCIGCRTHIDAIKGHRVEFDFRQGGIVCSECVAGRSGLTSLHKGTIKQLEWMCRGGLKQTGRIRFTSQAMKEGLALLENFGMYHLGKPPKSLAFLQQIRNETI